MIAQIEPRVMIIKNMLLFISAVRIA